MEKFLEQVADELIERHSAELSEVIIVLPAKRARLFLRKHLALKINRAFWSPEFYVMPEFISKISEQDIASELELTILLYQCYIKVTNDPDDFASFIKWSGLVLKDFNDIDASLANAEKVFSDLRNIREIEDWSFNSTALSAGQIQYLKFWSEIGTLHKEFRKEQILQNKWSYHSLLCHIIENTPTSFSTLQGKTIYFVGIASFSVSERKIIQQIQSLTTCELLWDYDKFYIENSQHEAGFFARQQISEGISVRWISEHLKSSEKRITFYQCTTSITQALAVSDELKKLSIEELNDTCVVLTDTSSLGSLLGCLADIKVPVNIAAGLPLKNSLTARFASKLFEIKQKEGGNYKGIYYKDLLEWLQIILQWHSDAVSCRKMIKEIRQNNIIYYQAAEIKKLFNPHLLFLEFADLLSFEDPVESMHTMVQLVSKVESEEALIMVANDKLTDVLNSLLKLVQRFSFLNSWNSIYPLFEVISGRESVFFEGEPVDGLQVLSMVETRALDFGQVFILDANEDFLPGNVGEQSFIPTDLRRHYKLPLPAEKEAMFAYTFYRLLQRANDIHLFYSSISADFKGTEQSRFITQIESELPEYNPGIRLNYRELKLGDLGKGEQFATSSEFSKRRLDRIFELGISPSAINKFNQCPLDFYYRYILGLGEEDAPEEQMSSATFGSIVHHVLEKFYRDFLDSYPMPVDYMKLKETLSMRIKEAIDMEYKIQHIDSGFNLLALSVAHSMLQNFIEYESELLKGRIEDKVKSKLLNVEFHLSRKLEHTKYAWDKSVSLKGKGDRVDEINGIHYILDYKTGKVESKDVNLINDVAKLFKGNKSSKQLQLLAYIYMYCGAGHPVERVRAGFYSFINHTEGYTFLDGKEDGVTDRTMLEFETAFMQWVKDLYALEKFEHNPDSKFCEYCR